MRLGLVHNFEEDYTLWVKELNITFFGCYESCSGCTNDNDSVSCSACNDGYYLSGTTCVACNSICKTCVTSASNCITCPDTDV